MNKAFTLAELMGVIVILGIIATIVTFTVDRNIQKSHVAACLAQEKTIIEAAKTRKIDKPNDSQEEITIATLIAEGYLDESLKNPMTKREYNDKTKVLNLNGEYKLIYFEEKGCTNAIMTVENRIELAKSMFENNYEVETIISYTNLSEEKIAEILPTIKSWTSDANTDFHEKKYKDNITSVIFEDSINIPAGTTNWDISEKANKSVMAWVTSDNNDSTKYVLHIAGKNGVVANTNSSYLFYEFANVKSINFNNNYDTSMVTNISQMFQDCSQLTTLNFGDKFNTGRVKNMSSMFSNCASLASLDLGDKFDTSNVTNMFDMFYNCKNLISLDLGDKFDTSKVKNMGSMFIFCNNLTSLDLGNKFDTSNVTNMINMFWDCKSLTNLDLGDKFDTSNVTSMDSMFNGCNRLTSLDLGNKFDTSKVTDMNNMFNGCNNLTSLKLGSKFDTSKVTRMGHMFSANKLTSLDLGDKFDTSNVKNMNGMFSSCNNLQRIYTNDKFVTTGIADDSSSNGGNLFWGDTKLVGGNGTTYSSEHIHKEYARIDKPGQPGYFTQK